MTRRQWLERGVIVVAALASIATSRKKWELAADLTADDPTKSRLVTIEANQQPEVSLDHSSSGVSLRPHEGGTVWPGTVRYLLPAGTRLEHVTIRDVCRGASGCSEGDCSIPKDRYVKLTSSTPVETWKLQITHEPQTITLEPGKYTHHSITIEATHRPRLFVETDGPAPSVYASTESFNLSWPDVTASTKVTWTPRIEIEGVCPGPAPCTAPSDAKVTITDIRFERY